MIIRWEDRDWSLHIADLTVKQAEVIEAAAGMTLEKWYGQLSEDAGGVSMLKTLYWLMKVQNGERMKMTEVDFPLMAFGTAFAEAAAAEFEEAEAAKEKAPDPTTPSPAASAPSRARSSRKGSRPVATVTGGPDG